jgi:hypothetical protein
LDGKTHTEVVAIFEQIPVGSMVRIKTCLDRQKYQKYQDTLPKPSGSRLKLGQQLQVLDSLDGRWYKAKAVKLTSKDVTLNYPELRGGWEETRPIGMILLGFQCMQYLI